MGKGVGRADLAIRVSGGAAKHKLESAGGDCQIPAFGNVGMVGYRLR